MMRDKIPILVMLLASTVVVAGFSGCVGETEGATVALSLHGPQASDGVISVKASVTGAKGDYRVSLSGPDGNTTCTSYIAEDQMDDCQSCCCLSLAEQYENPPVGEYVVTVCTYDGNEVLASGTIHYTGADVQIEDARFSWDNHENIPNALDSVTLSAVNHGEVAFVEYIKLHIGGNTVTSAIDPVYSTQHLYLDDTAVSLTASSFSLFAEDGTYEVTLELLSLSGDTMATLETITVVS